MRSSSLLRSRARGFTLIELMVVIVILGMLLVLVGPNVWNMLKGAQADTAKNQMRLMSQAINAYRIRNKSLPKSLEELTQEDPTTKEPYIDGGKIPVDPWGEPYEYKQLERGKFQLSSSGEDKQQGTDDDLYEPERDTAR
jgi:general secretion pathway protein G